MATNIDFTKIRGDTVEGQRAAFEQLVCNLARLDKRFAGEFRRIEGSGGDGGVEAIRIQPSGSEIGFQAKYHPNRDDIDWPKIDQSVEQALKHHPALKRYVISLPCDFTGARGARGGRTDGVWGKWDAKVEHWKTLAAARGMKVEFEPWTAFELEARLHDTDAQHLLRIFFDRLVFSRAWMKRHLDRTIRDLRARYSPDEHVDTESLKAFDMIFRRSNVRRDLQIVFDLARASNPRAAASLLDFGIIPEAHITGAEHALANFNALADGLDWPIHQRWPIEAWTQRWYAATRALSTIERVGIDWIYRNKQEKQEHLREQFSERTKCNALIGPEVFGGSWFHLLPIESSQAALFVGRAGAGKSHVLARGTEIAWREGAPAIHILGQHIVDDDPRISIMKRLELIDWTFHDVLSALNLVAEAADTRALLVIDALNEGRGLVAWRHHLASFITEVNKHDRIVLAVSCREEYLRYIVPPDLIADPRPYPGADGSPPKDLAPTGKFVCVLVEGFKTAEEREGALRKFMDEKGIVRPTAPVLDEEFFNPLFMYSVCRAMAAAKMTTFPRGLRGTRDVFGFALRTKCMALGTRYDSTDRPYVALRAGLCSLAKRMVERQSDSVPISEALSILDDAFQALPLTELTWLEAIEGADILRRDVDAPQTTPVGWSTPNEVIRFAFQRLQDNLVADYLVGCCEDIENAFSPNAPMEFLIERVVDRESKQAAIRLRPQWIGAIGAVWSAVAEKHGKELVDLESFFGDPDVGLYEDEFREVYRVSIRERGNKAFTDRTKGILDRLWRDYQPEKLEIHLSTACVPDHAWNADFLHDRMCHLSMPDRDSGWSRHFDNSSSRLLGQASGIIDWAINLNARAADREVVRLAALTLTWLLAVANRLIRDRATKALVNLFLGAPELFPDLLVRFHGVDDLYVLDRLLAAGYGSICLDPTDDRIRCSAQAVANVVFSGIEPPVHLAFRDWARLILERAHERGLQPPGFDMTRAKPPYGSAAPIFDVTESALEGVATVAGDNASRRFGDFYEKVIKSEVGEFSEISLTEPQPWTRDERAKRFEARVQDLGGSALAKLNALLKVLEAGRHHAIPVITRSKDSLTLSIEIPDRPQIVNEAIQHAEQEFLHALPAELSVDYTTELAPKIHGLHEPQRVRNFEPVGRWIARRVYEFGWTKTRFPTEPYSDSRERPKIERIGKKYQWLALEELMARLADNFWMDAGLGRATRRYEQRADIWHRDWIDPTILPRREMKSATARLAGPPVLSMEPVDDANLKDWPFRDDHFNDPEPWLRVEVKGRRHVVGSWAEWLDEKPPVETPTEPYRRQIQAFVSLVAHPTGERQRLLNGFFKNTSRGISEWTLKVQPEGVFAHEIGLLPPNAIPFWKHPCDDELRIASPIVTGGIEHETDQSIETSVYFLVPHPRIKTALDLRISDANNTGLWVGPDGAPFLIRHDVPHSAITIDEEQFSAWCLSEGLEYTWVYIGERTAWVGRDSARYRRTVGAAWYEDGLLCGAVQRPHG